MMKSTLVLAVALCISACLLLATEAAMCHGKPDPNAQPNMNPVYTQAPTFVRSCKQGKVYTVGEGDDSFPIVHVWGTPYEMGYAHGDCMKDKAKGLVDNLWTYLEQQVEEAINGTVTWIPEEALKTIADLGLDGALDLTELATRAYTGSYFYEEMRGLADATGLSYQRIVQIHMIGELTKGACSMFGAKGTATPNGKLLQMRALDWDTEGPFKDYPQVTVYHPADGNGHAFANVGWTGWVGSITGMSSAPLAICEIGVTFPDDTFGKDSRFGIPFTFILRDILQFDKSLPAARERITDAHRTCSLILGVGDGNLNDFNGIQYSHSVANYFEWDNMQPNATWHPRIQDIVYYGMDWLCPNYDEVISGQLQKYHGKLTPEIAIQQVMAITQTGNLHIAIYDFFNAQMYVANARCDTCSGAQYAYDRTYNRLDMNALWNEPAP